MADSMTSNPQDGPSEPEGLFVTLLTRNHSRLMGYIRTLVPHRQDAEDLFQKVSLTLWKKFDEYDQSRDFFPWASQIAFYTACNQNRAAYRNRLIFSPELMELMASERAQHLSAQSTRLDLLLDCVKLLQPVDQQLLMHAYEQGASVKEIAEQLGKAVQTIYNRLAMLRRDLINCVGQKLEAQKV